MRLLAYTLLVAAHVADRAVDWAFDELEHQRIKHRGRWGRR